MLVAWVGNLSKESNSRGIGHAIWMYFGPSCLKYIDCTDKKKNNHMNSHLVLSQKKIFRGENITNVYNKITFNSFKVQALFLLKNNTEYICVHTCAEWD